ncbi:hypothetical protein [Bradyrhizobium sp. STM 3809]|uniref:hypothetical protein n=1 Tax=Bradyrhizobium sp. STM 3809 TaxID=551936 RepID=UPI0005550983|nr:hypothetical protein [Bradyrhizobium sp. STM 3809]
MSLLGFDAIGRLAVAQLSRGAATTTIFVAAPSAFTVAGWPVRLQIVVVTNIASLGCAGAAIGARLSLFGSPSGSVTSGVGALSSLAIAAARGDFTASVNSAAATGRMLAASRVHALSGQPAAFTGSMAVESAAYQVNTYDVDYGRRFEDWYPLQGIVSGWSASADPAPSWGMTPTSSKSWQDSSVPVVSWARISPPAARWRSS